MAQSESKTCRIVLRVGAVVLLLLFLFFFGRPVFWKLSSILHDKQGLSGAVMETRKTVGWHHSDSGVRATNRRLLRY